LQPRKFLTHPYMRYLYGLPLFLLFIVNIVCAQDSTLQKVPAKYFSQVSGKSRQMQQQVDKRTAKALQRLQKQEKGMQSKLAKIDSIAAKNIFSHSIDSLGNLRSKLQQKAGKYNPSALGANYSGYLDTLQNSLSFLKGAKDLGGHVRFPKIGPVGLEKNL